MNKGELLKTKNVSKEELESRMLVNMKIVSAYLAGFVKSWDCKLGNHKWDRWNSRLLNVTELDILGEDRFSFRACDCGQEMPESRHYFQKDIREKNVVLFEE